MISVDFDLDLVINTLDHLLLHKALYTALGRYSPSA